jgi:aminoglycoside phosphotransferase (APT) family kinase protein
VATPEAEVEIDEGLVRALLDQQHPDLATLPLRHAATGWDNVIFRLGDSLSVRLPRRAVASWLLAQEQKWLPIMAVDLPLPVPVPIRVGQPGSGYPWPWSIGPWFHGDTAEATPPRDLDAAADTLGRFLAAVHRPAPPDAPRNQYRGIPLAEREHALCDGLKLLGDQVDQARALHVWKRALASRPWDAEPVWLHGDVHPLNLVVDEGQIAAVIDFGDICAGDPASDLAIGWMLFTGSSRRHFRETAGSNGAVDDDTWLRGWGWALALGTAFANGDDRVREIGLRTLHRALADDPG